MRRPIDERQAMATATDAGVLIGLDVIGRALGVSRDTARRYITELGLPARRMPDDVWIVAVPNLHRWLDQSAQARQPKECNGFAD